MTSPVNASKPAVVTRGSQGSRVAFGIGAAVAILLFFVPAILSDSVTNNLTQFFILLIMAIGWNLAAGYGGMVSIGHQAFIGFASYAVLDLSIHGILAWYCVPIAIILAGLVSIPVSWLAFRLRGGYFAIGTWVIAQVFQLVIGQQSNLGGGAGASLNDLNNLNPMTRDNITYWFALGLTLIALSVTGLLLRSKVGMALVAVRDEELSAAATGVNVVRTKRLVFVLSAAICGGAGSLLILSNLEVQPDSSFSIQYSAFMIFMVLVGGIGSFEGPIIGAIIFFTLQQSLSSYGAWYLVILGAFAVVVTLWLPRGIWGAIDPRHQRSLVPLRYRLHESKRDSSLINSVND
jgi:branched-chain amino acid transport system permease protein